MPPYGTIDELAARWRSRPDAQVTIALCEALRGAPSPTLVEEVGERAAREHASDAGVLLATARMYMAAQRLGDAQTTLVAAGKAAPRDAQVYRFLGEVLLRRGDADRAMRVLERALQFGATDAETRLWSERAKVFRSMQATSGMRAVAAEIARAAPLDAPRAAMDSITDTTTEVHVVKAPPLGGDDDDDDELTRRPAPIPRELKALDPAPPPANAMFGAATGANVLAMPLGGPDEPSVTARFTPASVTPGRAAGALFEEPATREPFQPIGAAPPVPQPPPRDPFASVYRAGGGAVAPGGPAGAKAPPLPTRAIAAPPTNAPIAQQTRDVLDALEAAGLFEPDAVGGAQAATWDAAAKAPRSRGSIALIASTILFAGATAGALFYVRDKRAKEHAEAEALLSKVDETLHAADGDRLAASEQQLMQAFELDSRSPRAALTWLHERATKGLLEGGEEIAFEDSLTRANEVGVKEESLAFARVASFLFQGDTVGAAALLPKWDDKAGKDAWYQLLAGASLARAGDTHAIDRFDAATKLDPGMVLAQIELARQAALDGEPAKAMTLAKHVKETLPGRAEGPALVTLAWARDPARGDPPEDVDATINAAADLPLPLRFVPHAALAIRAVQSHAWDDARGEVQKGLDVADGPGVASWLGTIALATADEQLARKAALAAVSFSAVFPPARMLAARVALVGDRLDEALKATEELDPTSPDVAVVRGAVAYERLDVDGLARAVEAIPEEQQRAPFLAALLVAPDVLAGLKAVPPEKLVAMADDEAPWSDLVAMDAALDQGDVEAAETIAQQWAQQASWAKTTSSPGMLDRPLRALRVARLARYDAKLDAAEASSQLALDAGTVTPRVLAERVFVLVARGRPQDAGPLLAKYPLVLGPTGTWLSAYVAASQGKVDEARARTTTLDPPPPGAPVLARTIAASALAAMHDRRRAADVLKPLLAAGYVSSDLQAAAIAAGFRKVEHKGKKPTFEGP